MLLTENSNLAVLKVVLAAIFTSAIAVIWLACALMGYVAIQQSPKCPVSPSKTLHQSLE
jgi:hypothetical protein